MDELQIQLLYCHYGWTVEQISAHFGTDTCPVSYLRSLIKERGWETPKDLVPVESLDPNNPSQSHISWLKDRELDKQSLTSPLLALMEISLMRKMSDTINSLDTERHDAHTVISNITKAITQLKEGGVAAHVVETAKDNPGIAIQVVNNI